MFQLPAAWRLRSGLFLAETSLKQLGIKRCDCGGGSGGGDVGGRFGGVSHGR